MGCAGIVVLVTIICYVACFSSGVATIAWIGTELIPLEVRALGTMLVSDLIPRKQTYTDLIAEHCDVLEHKYHYRVDFFEYDEGVDS